jgi:hypothetical protein
MKSVSSKHEYTKPVLTKLLTAQTEAGKLNRPAIESLTVPRRKFGQGTIYPS